MLHVDLKVAPFSVEASHEITHKPQYKRSFHLMFPFYVIPQELAVSYVPTP